MAPFWAPSLNLFFMVHHFMLAIIKCSDLTLVKWFCCCCFSPWPYLFHHFVTCHIVTCTAPECWYKSDDAVQFQYHVFCFTESWIVTLYCVFIGHNSSLRFMKTCLGRSEILCPLSNTEILQQDATNMLLTASSSKSNNSICQVISFSVS